MQTREGLLAGLVIIIAIFGVVGSMPLLPADNDDSVSVGGNVSVSAASDDENDSDNERENKSDEEDDDSNDDDNDTIEIENSEDDENDDDSVRTTTSTNANCTVRIEREIKVEDGKRTEIIKRKIKCRDGVESEFQLKIMNRTENGMTVEKFRYEIKGKDFEIEAEDEIDLEENTSGKEYRLRARLRNGNYTDIKIMPDTASEIALERLRALNFTIQLRERIHNNIPRVVYNIESNENGKFLGIFKIAMRANAEVDPETGEVLDVNTPWWAFMVAKSADADANADAAAGGTFPEGTETNNTDEENAAA